MFYNECVAITENSKEPKLEYYLNFETNWEIGWDDILVDSHTIKLFKQKRPEPSHNYVECTPLNLLKQFPDRIIKFNLNVTGTWEETRYPHIQYTDSNLNNIEIKLNEGDNFIEIKDYWFDKENYNLTIELGSGNPPQRLDCIITEIPHKK